MMTYGLAPRAGGSRFVSEQGVKMGRRSVLHILVHGEDGADGIEVGGNVTPVGRGTLTVSSGNSPNG
jgi:predicted PhzF superfamily epimerase YddE/YHI9